MRQKAPYAIFLLALSALSLFFVWPIYQDLYLLVTAGVALGVGSLIGALKENKGYSPLTALLLTLGAYLVLALPLANPRALSNPAGLLSGLGNALKGPVDAWKQIITIDLPIGTYQTLLSPVFVLYLITGVVYGWLLFTQKSRFWIASIPVIAIVLFAIGFGIASVPGDFQILGVSLPVPTPIASGTLLFALLVIYLNWGARFARRDTLVTRLDAPAVTGKSVIRRVRKFGMAALVVLTSATITAATMQISGLPNSRTVLRSGVEQLQVIQNEKSPLSTYRTYFNNPELLENELLTYSTDGSPERIRLVTMPYYNGEAFTVAPTDKSIVDSNIFFSRLASEIPNTGSGDSQAFQVQVGALDVVWLPTAAGLKRITFEGSDSAEISDSLFLNRNTQTVAIIPGGSQGAGYEIEYTVPEVLTADQIEPGSPSIPKELVPEAITEWLELQKITSAANGQDIVALAELLRKRGYLSHSLVEPVAAENQAETWLNKAGGEITFQPSTPGHNLGRISKMFADLNALQSRSSGKANLVGAIGDDEQFATAIALIATANNFPARVVVGFRTASAEEVPGVPACAESGGTGVCTGANLTAWAEIKGSGDQWLPIDATPQFEVLPNLAPPPPGDPKNPTSAGEDAAGVLPPSKAVPSNDKCPPEDPDCTPPPTCEWCEYAISLALQILQVTLIIFIFVAPFLLILIMKRRRRKSRRNNSSSFARVVGAWEEYVDMVIDYGGPVPVNKTRLEIARDEANIENKNVLVLAELANQMAYGSSEFESIDITDQELDDAIDLSWSIFDEEFEKITSKTKGLNQIRASLSIRSFIRVLKPKEQLAKLSGAIKFTQGSSQSEGSQLSAFYQMAKKQVLQVFPKK